MNTCCISFYIPTFTKHWILAMEFTDADTNNKKELVGCIKIYYAVCFVPFECSTKVASSLRFVWLLKNIPSPLFLHGEIAVSAL